VPSTATADEVVALLERGDLAASSFAFRAERQRFRDDGTRTIREILGVELFDCSVVASPAYPAASAGLGSFPPAGRGRGTESEEVAAVAAAEARARLLELQEKA